MLKRFFNLSPNIKNLKSMSWKTWCNTLLTAEYGPKDPRIISDLGAHLLLIQLGKDSLEFLVWIRTVFYEKKCAKLDGILWTFIQRYVEFKQSSFFVSWKCLLFKPQETSHNSASSLLYQNHGKKIKPYCLYSKHIQQDAYSDWLKIQLIMKTVNGWKESFS